ncbi:tRNA (guanosine(46)-N7)-methyltransferase TrmB [Mycoplasmopsis alligatoris]|uniref:tRNA (guanine-N(7)-)-methyltransferase n=1 Tax=Mycoplasmopsis alligatoris A21JP2 TaxID=747682 RepID=D4XVN2_9BACT|nr:tRNA (guanosine(46)-N7)-methyltransferase TrmB [Mycoplasmopsis alligatoris]EFF41594.1 tRNA (guanine-N(7)-)-methyltransferase [Mycoplasmopsis alligatoris A21JP2]
MRLRNDKDALVKLQSSKFYIDAFPIGIDKDSIIEIGAGKGEMISQLALNNSHIKYYAFEKYETVAAKIIKKIDELELKNLYVICQDAINLSQIFTGKILEMWLTFSDPWPKKRHEKRRLTYKTFLDEYACILDKNGILKLKTDNDKLFDYSIESLELNKWQIINVTRDLHKSEFSKNNYMTGYEQKWSSLGKNINYLEAKIPNN